MSQNERDLIDRIFNPKPKEGENTDENNPQDETANNEAETTITPLPLKTVEQLLREAKNPPNTQTG